MKAPQVLVIEDDADLCRLLCEVFRGSGYSVLAASNAFTALQLLQSGSRPNLILLDIMLPGMNGWDFCNLRKDDPVLVEIPLVILSAFAGPSRERPYIGVEAIVEKPFDIDKILETCSKFLPLEAVLEAGTRDSKPVKFDVHDARQ